MKNLKCTLSVAETAACIDRLHRFYFASTETSPELDALLCYILECNVAGNPVCSTDLVRMQRFGTLPTLTGRLARLSETGLITQVVADDRRIKLLEVTPKGVASLESRQQLLTGDGPTADGRGS